MDLAETMKQVLASKGPGGSLAQNSATAGTSSMGSSGMHQMQQNDNQMGGVPGVGYVTEKLYMLLQLYLQNKGWNPSVELLQCFSELKDSALLPSAAYLQ